jgi:hypothetical protein
VVNKINEFLGENKNVRKRNRILNKWGDQ